MSKAEGEFIIIVPLPDVLTDLDIFDGEDKTKVQEGSLCLLIKRQRSVYILDKHLDLLLLVLMRQVERMGVPHSSLPEEPSASADMSEWFDPRVSKWHLRVPGSEAIITSQQVPRTSADGKPLDAQSFQNLKFASLVALKSKSKIASFLPQVSSE